MHKRAASIAISATLLVAPSLAAPRNDQMATVTVTSQLTEGTAYTHTLTAGPTATVVVGKAPATEYITMNLAEGADEYTVTVPGDLPNPTCTVIYGRPIDREVYNMLTDEDDL